MEASSSIPRDHISNAAGVSNGEAAKHSDKKQTQAEVGNRLMDLVREYRHEKVDLPNCVEEQIQIRTIASRERMQRWPQNIKQLLEVLNREEDA